jgi:hypothetical protein
MTGPAWLAAALATAMLVTAAYCAVRLVISWWHGRPTDHALDAVHVLMGVSMAGLLVPGLRVFRASGWAVVFAVAAGWFAWRAVSRRSSDRGAVQDAATRTAATRTAATRTAATRTASAQSPGARLGGHQVQHAVSCAAMLFMLLRTSAAGAKSPGAMTAASAGGHDATLALALAVVLLGFVVWTADRSSLLAPVAAMSGGTGSGPGTRCVPLSPRLAATCEIVMGLAMAYMLILML